MSFNLRRRIKVIYCSYLITHDCPGDLFLKPVAKILKAHQLKGNYQRLFSLPPLTRSLMLSIWLCSGWAVTWLLVHLTFGWLKSILLIPILSIWIVVMLTYQRTTKLVETFQKQP